MKETYEVRMNAACDLMSSVFSRGRAVWLPWETESVEPVFGTYHFFEGQFPLIVKSSEISKR